MFIYLIRDAQFLKVGLAGRVDQRLKQLQAANPRKLALIGEYKLATSFAWKVEARAHKELAEFHVRNEWFLCDDETAKSAVNFARVHYADWHIVRQRHRVLKLFRKEPWQRTKSRKLALIARWRERRTASQALTARYGSGIAGRLTAVQCK